MSAKIFTQLELNAMGEQELGNPERLPRGLKTLELEELESQGEKMRSISAERDKHVQRARGRRKNMNYLLPSLFWVSLGGKVQPLLSQAF